MKQATTLSRRNFLVSAAAAAAVGSALPFKVSAASALESAARPSNPAIPGYRERPVPGGRLPSQWSNVLARHEIQNREAIGAAYADPWRQLLGHFRGRQLDVRLLADINDAINRLSFVPDPANYGISDRWATPREFLAKGGDCEDFAIAKFLVLRELGYDQLNKKLVVCRHDIRKEAHAVVTCTLHNKIYVLDNLNVKLTEGWPTNLYTAFYGIDEGTWVIYSKVLPSFVS